MAEQVAAGTVEGVEVAMAEPMAMGGPAMGSVAAAEADRLVPPADAAGSAAT